MKAQRLLLVTIVVAATLLSACSPNAGETVSIRDGAHGCKTWSPPDLAWVTCYPVGGSKGVVENHPTDDVVGHAYEGRVRIRLEGGGIVWVEEGDLIH